MLKSNYLKRESVFNTENVEMELLQRVAKLLYTNGRQISTLGSRLDLYGTLGKQPRDIPECSSTRE